MFILWLGQHSTSFEATVVALAATAVAYSLLGLRYGVAAAAAALPSLVFVAIVLFFPVQTRVGREFFATTAQLIPVLFIAFAVESGVVRQKTRFEIRILAVLLGVLLALGEAAALMGLAALSIDPPMPGGEEGARTWHLTMNVAAIVAGFMSIVISMLIREEPGAHDLYMQRQSAPEARARDSISLSSSSECLDSSANRRGLPGSLLRDSPRPPLGLRTLAKGLALMLLASLVARGVSDRRDDCWQGDRRR